MTQFGALHTGVLQLQLVRVPLQQTPDARKAKREADPTSLRSWVKCAPTAGRPFSRIWLSCMLIPPRHLVSESGKRQSWGLGLVPTFLVVNSPLPKVTKCAQLWWLDEVCGAPKLTPHRSGCVMQERGKATKTHRLMVDSTLLQFCWAGAQHFSQHLWHGLAELHRTNDLWGCLALLLLPEARNGGAHRGRRASGQGPAATGHGPATEVAMG